LKNVNRSVKFKTGINNTAGLVKATAEIGVKYAGQGEMMNRSNKANKKVWKVLLLTALLMAWGLGMGFAQEAEKILPINPVPDFNAGKSAPEPDLDGRGVIQDIRPGEMVIGDVQLLISSKTEYFRSDGTLGFYSEFVVGKVVGYRLKSKYEIIELWMLDIEP
jgi:hypothetical protein